MNSIPIQNKSKSCQSRREISLYIYIQKNNGRQIEIFFPSFFQKQLFNILKNVSVCKILLCPHLSRKHDSRNCTIYTVYTYIPSVHGIRCRVARLMPPFVQIFVRVPLTATLLSSRSFHQKATGGYLVSLSLSLSIFHNAVDSAAYAPLVCTRHVLVCTRARAYTRIVPFPSVLEAFFKLLPCPRSRGETRLRCVARSRVEF